MLNESNKKAGCDENIKPFRGLGAILFKEFIVVWRDPMTLFFMFFPPLIEMIAFGYALDNDVKHMAMADSERRSHRREPPVDRSLCEHGDVSRCRRSAEPRSNWRAKSAKAALMSALEIPPNFTRDLHAGHSAQVQLLVDGSNSTTALQALNTGTRRRV